MSPQPHAHAAPLRADVDRPRPGKARPLPKAPTSAIEVEGTARALAAASGKVALRALVVGVDGDDFGLATWKAVLDRVGMPYDVVESRSQPLPALVREDGTGRYDAVLLTDNALLYDDGGGFVSGLDAGEWNALWAYERDFQVRQVSLYTAYGAFPEDYCLRPGSEGGVGATPVTATLTPAGAAVFDDLKGTVPISQSYVYRAVIGQGCQAEPILTVGSDVVGVRSNSADGRERMALTFTSNQYLPQADLLTYGLLRWATRGVMLGERRHYLNVDVDDWFSHTSHLRTDGTVDDDPGFRISRNDADGTYNQQQNFRTAHPLAAGFRLNVAYNGEGANPNAPKTCILTLLSPDPLTSYSRCRASAFSWINHTFSHPKMNTTDYQTSYKEIVDNLTRAQQLGLAVDRTVLKTGEYSGLGVYHPDPANDIDPPTDHGLAASNPALLQAAKAAGVKYLHGNMSFASHRPACFNCGIRHPLEPSLLVVPDWPTNVAYHVTTPAEQTVFYNSYYGPNGRFPYWPTNQTYTQIVGHESDVALQHVMSGSVYTHTFHQGNLRGTPNLVFDWLNAVMTKYRGYYKVPVLTPTWTELAGHVEARTAHFAALQQVDAVFDRQAATVTFTSSAAGAVFATNAGANATPYGTDRIARITLTPVAPVTVPASVRP
ncbi:Agd3-related carbohydrate deacetylase [Nonomuraea sp. NPDC004354]